MAVVVLALLLDQTGEVQYVLFGLALLELLEPSLQQIPRIYKYTDECMTIGLTIRKKSP
jgi:hypothetical protein